MPGNWDPQSPAELARAVPPQFYWLHTAIQ